jgi:hypothetical protein
MAEFLSYQPFRQQVEYRIVHRNLQSGNINATPDHLRPSLDFARGRVLTQHQHLALSTQQAEQNWLNTRAGSEAC